jgi:Flp pilus assembly pilin Flp
MQWTERAWPILARLHSRWHGLVSNKVAAQSTVEYALVGALVVIAAAGALTVLGSELTAVFSNISRTLGAAAAH